MATEVAPSLHRLHCECGRPIAVEQPAGGDADCILRLVPCDCGSQAPFVVPQGSCIVALAGEIPLGDAIPLGIVGPPPQAGVPARPRTRSGVWRRRESGVEARRRVEQLRQTVARLSLLHASREVITAYEEALDQAIMDLPSV